MKSITARQVRRILSGIDELCRILSVRYGIEVAAERSENPDNPRNNALIISFEFADGKEEHFLAARDILINTLLRKDLTLEHECNGDGETGTIFAYRVLAA